ncbi:hypothetical protein KDW_05240 [Dictyobacter vulcani]|uniref:Uncharacterized protein n=1 Tax=Dictyobacter vulcani TaxID=2607529 RepID=A0A5J4KHM8_9CHLR|nr:hypothetical protein [Dictyobacter vulcani]GER86362.1 hypothetical protein KDW_05240 [Dictyobacter vulcani]
MNNIEHIPCTQQTLRELIYSSSISLALALFAVFVIGVAIGVFNPTLTGPRSFWLWILFLLLTIDPAIRGARFKLSEAESIYLHIVLSPHLSCSG